MISCHIIYQRRSGLVFTTRVHQSSNVISFLYVHRQTIHSAHVQQSNLIDAFENIMLDPCLYPTSGIIRRDPQGHVVAVKQVPIAESVQFLGSVSIARLVLVEKMAPVAMLAAAVQLEQAAMLGLVRS